MSPGQHPTLTIEVNFQKHTISPSRFLALVLAGCHIGLDLGRSGASGSRWKHGWKSEMRCDAQGKRSRHPHIRTQSPTPLHTTHTINRTHTDNLHKCIFNALIKDYASSRKSNTAAQPYVQRPQGSLDILSVNANMWETDGENNTNEEEASTHPPLKRPKCNFGKRPRITRRYKGTKRTKKSWRKMKGGVEKKLADQKKMQDGYAHKYGMATKRKRF